MIKALNHETSIGQKLLDNFEQKKINFWQNVIQLRENINQVGNVDETSVVWACLEIYYRYEGDKELNHGWEKASYRCNNMHNFSSQKSLTYLI